MWDEGLREYCYNLWNILDFITNSLYLSTFALRTVAYLQVARVPASFLQVEAEARDPALEHIGRHLQRR